MKYTEIDQNRIIISQKTCNRGHSWSVTSDYRHQTDGRTEIHTFFIWYPRVGREHNSPSGKEKMNLCLETLSDQFPRIKEMNQFPMWDIARSSLMN